MVQHKVSIKAKNSQDENVLDPIIFQIFNPCESHKM
jgi:hypothetical protein